MKRFLLATVALCLSASLMAQSITQPGVYDRGGNAVEMMAQPCYVTVLLTVETTTFEPGVYARYAQKLLGERASLAERREVKLVAASIEQGRGAIVQPTDNSTVEAGGLASNRFNGSAMSLEEQATATANLIFSLRKHRLELVTGELGEGVFGAGLQAALEEIARLESESLAMFYGVTRTAVSTVKYVVEIKGDVKDYMVCRYREDTGVVALDNLSGELVSLHIDTADTVPSSLVAPGPKDRSVSEYIVVNPSLCTLSCGAAKIATADMVLMPYAKRVVARTIR